MCLLVSLSSLSFSIFPRPCFPYLSFFRSFLLFFPSFLFLSPFNSLFLLMILFVLHFCLNQSRDIFLIRTLIYWLNGYPFLCIYNIPSLICISFNIHRWFNVTRYHPSNKVKLHRLSKFVRERERERERESQGNPNSRLALVIYIYIYIYMLWSHVTGSVTLIYTEW